MNSQLAPDAYDPPTGLEGENMGLIEALAAQLWRKRAKSYSGGASFDQQSVQVKVAWRMCAEDALGFLFRIGFIGPAGNPDEDRFEGWSYCWMYSASEWEIIDADGGYIALVRETNDLEVMLAAPAMRTAIKALLSSIPDDHPTRQLPEMVALAGSLPEAFKAARS